MYTLYKKENIGVLALDNGKKNLLEWPDFIDKEELVNFLGDKNLVGLIIHGKGRNFSAGADLDNLKKLSNKSNELTERIIRGKMILDIIEDAPLPVVAAIDGACFGGGLEIALAAHIRMASPRALLAFPEVNYGLIPGLGGIQRLTKLIGKKAFRIVLEADTMNVERAQELGIIDEVAETNEVFEFAYNFIKKITRDRNPEIVRSVIRSMNNYYKLKKEQALMEETKLFFDLARKADFY